MVTDSELLQNVFITHGQKRHSRIKGYYICGHCALQFIYNRAFQSRECPMCNHLMKLLSKVDEHEINRIRMWSYNNLYIEGENLQRKKERRMA